MKLKDKVAIITGGAGGIGQATALKFVAEGATVVIADRNEEQGKFIVEKIQSLGGTASFFHLDITKFHEVETLVNDTVDRYGRLDILFNNAGVTHYKPLLEQDPLEFNQVIQVNLYGVYNSILAAGRKMKELEIPGVIINTASVFAYIGSVGLFGYHASKGAVKSMTQAAAMELAPYGIRVVGIAPGVVDTPMIQRQKDAGLQRYLEEQQMNKRLIQPEEIANLVAFLASDEASVVNGSIVMADAGYLSFKRHSSS